MDVDARHSLSQNHSVAEILRESAVSVPSPVLPSRPTSPAMLDSPSTKPEMLSAFSTRENSPIGRHASHLVLGAPTVMPRTPKPLTPRPQTGESAQGAPSQRSPEMNRPLNVTDALSYLDAVKYQFQEKPEVYNKFLDIMKDFKSQQIDTPGVIERVSRLFHGNPPLIQGFNTFLPVGYRIDVSGDPMDPNTITVTTPMGTTTQSTNGINHIRPVPPRDIPGFGPNLAQPFAFPTPNILPPLSRSRTPQQPFPLPHAPSPYEQAFSPGFQQTQTTAAASLLGNLSNKNPVKKQPQEEFNHAIQYLNKIKSRYSDDTNTYKQFLDILQTYQKEQRHLHDSQVYTQVQMLFKDAPDLLAEFKDFLPEAVGGHSHGGNVMFPQSGAPATAGSSSQPWPQPDLPVPSSPDKPSKKPAQGGKRKKRVPEKEPTPVPSVVKPVSSRVKKPKHSHKPDPSSPSFSPFFGPNSPQQMPAHLSVPQPPPVQLHAPPFAPPLSAPSPPDKLMFFDRAKKSLENRELYEEFLKLLSLFAKDIIDVKILLDRTRSFLGDGELMDEFKELVGWDPRQDNVENGPPGSIRTGPPEALSALPSDDGQGPSYRKLPWSEVRLACSGRDELCRSVLNDHWVSHPTWASEEAGFLTLKKNSFEDALHKSEEERHEYHVHLEAMTRTIAVLDPLNARIEEMSNEERAGFKLGPNLGGPSRCIYHRIIKKVYGRDGGNEVLQALQDCPGVAVPVVLARLKQKDEEWRRAHREWSRTWREVDCKNFYKSLDHQGISFKQNDKKNITAKHFVADIEAIQAQQIDNMEKRARVAGKGKQKADLPAFARGSLGFQLEYQFQDMAVLQDSLKLVYLFLERSPAQYSALERRSVEKFLQTFVPLLCMFPVGEFSNSCEPQHDAGSMIGDDDGSTAAESSISGMEQAPGSKGGRRSMGQSNGVAAGDLRKKLLRSIKDKTNGRDHRGRSVSVGASRAGSPLHESHRSSNAPASRSDEDPASAEDIWIRESPAMSGGTSAHFTVDNPNGIRGGENEKPFFANTTFYTLLRLLQLLYSRLLMCKEIGQNLASTKHAYLLANPVAVELGLDDPNGPATVLAQAMEVNGDANVVYMYLLEACEKVFSGDLDQVSFEEHMRWFFGNKAYHMFTLDKLITALVKQVQTITTDAKCQELWSLLQSAQNSDAISNQDIIRYRREAERHVGQDDHLYRIQWAREVKTIRIQLMRAEDASVDGGGQSKGRWREYVDTYVLGHPTEWMPTKPKGQAYLGRSRDWNEKRKAAREGEISIGISLPTYKIVYERGCEEILVGRIGRRERRELEESACAREEERRRWLKNRGLYL